ncbi:sigma-70 family RNA polymerase sigma factor [Myxococcota bacterium]|nr:sigma-70 family RNA polymerase sigma factor [Myxococcota bacterium]
MRFQDNEVAAFEEILVRFERRLFGYILRFVRDEATAQDLVQETFMRVIKSKATYRPTGAFGGFIFRIARNLALSLLRERHSHRQISLEQPTANQSWSFLDLIEGDSLDGFEHINLQRTRHKLEAAIATLKENQREIFLLRQFGELKFREISELLEVPMPTVRSRMYYALNHIRRALADELKALPGFAEAG